jgi:hypothetical protein
MREMIHLKQKESSNDDDDVIEFEKSDIHLRGTQMDFKIVDPFTGKEVSPTDLNPSYPTSNSN